MKIQPISTTNPYVSSKTKDKAYRASSSSKDSIHLSGSSKDTQVVLEALEQDDKLKAEKVLRLKQEIANGTFEINEKKMEVIVARLMMHI